mgnify:CR=1 FL=1
MNFEVVISGIVKTVKRKEFVKMDRIVTRRINGDCCVPFFFLLEIAEKKVFWFWRVGKRKNLSRWTILLVNPDSNAAAMINESRGTGILPRKLRKFILPARFPSRCKRVRSSAGRLFALSPGRWRDCLDRWRGRNKTIPSKIYYGESRAARQQQPISNFIPPVIFQHGPPTVFLLFSMKCRDIHFGKVSSRRGRRKQITIASLADRVLFFSNSINLSLREDFIRLLFNTRAWSVELELECEIS